MQKLEAVVIFEAQRATTLPTHTSGVPPCAKNQKTKPKAVVAVDTFSWLWASSQKAKAFVHLRSSMCGSYAVSHTGCTKPGAFVKFEPQRTTVQKTHTSGVPP